MDGFVDVLGSDALAPGGMTGVEAHGKTVLLARVDDDFYATQARCPHMGGNLLKGTLEGSVVTCPLHASQFDVTDGSVVRWTDWTGVLEAVGDALRHPRPLTTYEVRVEAGRVMIGAEKPSADPE